MKRRHIAIFTHMGSAHVYPALGLCSELVKRGHRVTYATNANYAPRVSQTGAEPVIFKALKLENADGALRLPPAHDPNFWTTYASIFGPLHLIHAAGTLSQIEGYYDVNRPDLILDDRLHLVGRMLAARLGCEAVQSNPHFSFYKNFLVREDAIFLNPEPMLAFAKLLDSFLRTYGVKDSDNLWHAERLNICFVPKEFQFHGDSFDERFCFVGPCLNRPVSSVWKNNSDGKPIILISGSQIDANDTKFFRTMINALSDSKFFVVLSPGGSISEDSLGGLPDNFEINKDSYNLQVLPHATLAISQGGTGMVMECLYYGVPVLVVPRSPVQAEVAYRVAELGLGVYIREQELSTDTIKESVDKILGDAALINRVNRMQQIVRNSGGTEMAASRIERFLEC